MAQSSVNIPHSIDEKGSFEDAGDFEDAQGRGPGNYTVPSLDVDISIEPDRSRKRRFSVSAESNTNDDSDFEDDLDDDSKSQSHHSRNSSGSNHSTSHQNKSNGSSSHSSASNPNGASSSSNGSKSSLSHNSSSNSHNNENNSHSTNRSNGSASGSSNSSSSSGNFASGRKKKHFIRKIYPKTQAAKSRIYASVSDLFLWNGLDQEQQNLLVDAMFEKKVKKNENIITQGDRGDYFYVIENGVYEVWKREEIVRSSGRRGGSSSSRLSEAKQVYCYEQKGSFGELALMYNSPRAATVRATTDGILWAVDRKTFRHIIVGSTARKRHRYDKFLKTVQIFDKLPGTTTSQVADILEGFEFRQGEKIVQQGSSDCEKFYLIQSGTANVVVTSGNGSKQIVSKLRDGDFFGERALLENDVRSASVVVTSKSLTCCAMDKASFMRLLHSLYDYFKMRMKTYTDASDLDGSKGKELYDDDIHSDLEE